MALDEEALICDLAQVYGVLDHEQLPPWKLAVLTKGLPPTSRIKQAVFAKLAEDSQQHITLAEFEAERERFLQERGLLSHGSD